MILSKNVPVTLKTYKDSLHKHVQAVKCIL